MPAMNVSATNLVVYGWERAKKCAYLLNMSTTTRIEVLPAEEGRPSMKSTVMSSQT
jgi:hypothetical protein